jgi:antitoxin MazE
MQDIHSHARIWRKEEPYMRIAKWGNSLAVRLPAAVVEALDLKDGDDIELTVLDERALAVTRKPSRDELLERLRAFRGRLPEDFKFDRDEANAR